MNDRIKEIENKLDDMRERYKTASPAMKKFLKNGADLLIHEREVLKRKLEQSKLI